MFVSALRDALLRGEVDVAVHSLKDLPTAAPEGIALAAVPPREDPRDVVVARDGLTLGELPAGSRVGTGSPRRVAQLHALGLGLDVVGIRGNVDTRIGKVRSGEYDAVLLARAGLARIGRLEEVTEVLDPLQMLPAPGQGALAVECRADDDLVADAGRARRPRQPRHRRGRARRAGHPRGRLLRARSARWPRSPRATTATSSGSARSRSRATAALSVRMSATGDPDDAAGLGARLAKEMLADGAGDLEPDRCRTRRRQGARRMTRGKTDITTTDRTGSASRGWVSFVGSGPGDPDLLTVRAVTLLEQAEVIVTEAPEHVDLVRRLPGACPAEAEWPLLVDGGFGEDGQPLTHAARAKVVVRHAKKGQRVVRLMTGDPFLYASGPEEAQACVKAGLGFEIVPGVSSVGAVPAYAGIPLTTKDHREVAVVTAHEKVDWSQYADDRTLVVLSGVNMVGDIAAALVAAGRDPETPDRDDPGRHHHRADHRHLDAGRHRRRRPRRPDVAARP